MSHIRGRLLQLSLDLVTHLDQLIVWVLEILVFGLVNLNNFDILHVFRLQGSCFSWTDFLYLHNLFERSFNLLQIIFISLILLFDFEEFCFFFLQTFTALFFLILQKDNLHFPFLQSKSPPTNLHFQLLILILQIRITLQYIFVTSNNFLIFLFQNPTLLVIMMLFHIRHLVSKIVQQKFVLLFFIKGCTCRFFELGKNYVLGLQFLEIGEEKLVFFFYGFGKSLDFVSCEG